MGDDIDDIERAYRQAGGGQPATKEFCIRPSWWNQSEFNTAEVAGMVGKCVERAYAASYDHAPIIRRITVERDGIHVTALTVRLVRRGGRGTVDMRAPPDGWLDECIGSLQGQFDALGRFHG